MQQRFERVMEKILAIIESQWR